MKMSCIDDFMLGTYVHHEVYGYGSIINIDENGEKCTLLFEDGFQDRFTIQHLIDSNGFYVLSRKRERVSDLWDWD